VTKVAVLDDYQARAHEFGDWDQLGAEVVFFEKNITGAALVTALGGFDTVVAMRERTAFPRSVLEALPDLRLLITTGMGNASFDMDAARDLGITVCGTRGGAASTTELTWAILLAAVKNIAHEHRVMREGGWQHRLAGDLAGQRLGLIGLGRLGQAMLPGAAAFGLKVSAWSQNLTAERAAEAGVEFSPTLDALLESSDIVAINLKLSDRTVGLIGAEQLARMQPGALLVNTSRGPIVDEAALVAALRSGRINAALDVYDVEPLPADHPLRTLDNVVLSPHLGYSSANNFAIMYPDAIEDIAAFVAGTPIRVVTV
jgi:phosphoglycerate dehydrogenase-like enzyme